MKWSTALAALILAIPSVAAARCAEGTRVFSGVVVDKRGAPISGAVIGIAWAELDGVGGPSLGATDSRGRYRVRILFSRYSGKGRIHEDECTFVPKEVSVSAYGRQLVSAARKVLVGPATEVVVPPLQVAFSSSPDQEPVVHLLRPGG